MNSNLFLDLKTLKNDHILVAAVFIIILLLYPYKGLTQIIIDIDGPSITKIQIAIPDFKNFTKTKENPELSAALANVITNDLDLSGYFLPMDKNSFLDEDGPGLTADNIRFRNWSLIGTQILLKGGYTCIGRSIEVDVRLYDADWGTPILGKKFLGKINEYRYLMHRIGNEIINEIIYSMKGDKGIFLSKFAFVNNSTGNNEIYICDFDGFNIERLTTDKSIDMLPRWSPRGDSIVYNSFKEGMEPMLYLMDISTGRVKKISGRKGLNTGARWSDDGQTLDLTLSHNGNPDIYSIDLNGKIIKQLTRHWGIDISPSRSPDRQKITFVSNRSGSPQIYVKDLKTGTEERLTFDLKYCTSPVWSSLNKIAFSGIEDSQFDIYTMDPDGSNLRKLTHNNGNNEDPCWSQDGRYIAFSSNRAGGSHIYIMNSNGQNQRRISFFQGEETTPSWSPY